MSAETFHDYLMELCENEGHPCCKVAQWLYFQQKWRSYPRHSDNIADWMDFFNRRHSNTRHKAAKVERLRAAHAEYLRQRQMSFSRLVR